MLDPISYLLSDDPIKPFPLSASVLSSPILTLWPQSCLIEYKPHPGAADMGIDREESNTGSSNFVRDGRGQPRDQISFVPEIADPGQRTDAARTSYGS